MIFSDILYKNNLTSWFKLLINKFGYMISAKIFERSELLQEFIIFRKLSKIELYKSNTFI